MKVVSGHEAVERMPDDDEVEARLDESREVVEVVGSHVPHQSERQKRKSLAIENGISLNLRPFSSLSNGLR